MNALTLLILIFSIAGGLDYLFGNKLGLGKEFERGVRLLPDMVLSMIGMIVIAPWIAELLSPTFDWMYRALRLDPSVIPASLFANDMGGAPLATAVAKNESVGAFNALVVSSMMGCTVSFTIPVSLQIVDKKHHYRLALGLLCGIVTIPFGCFVAGLFCDLRFTALLVNLLPLLILAIILSVGLLFFPSATVKAFKGIGAFIKILIVAGLLLGIVNFLAGEPVIGGLATLEEGASVCVNASIVLTGMFPFLYLVFKLIDKPIKGLGKKLDINEISVANLFGSLATSMPTFSAINQMDDKGIILNGAFMVSGAFTFGGHLAFTMAYKGGGAYVLPVLVGKLVAGILSLLLAYFLFCRKQKEKTEEAEASV